MLYSPGDSVSIMAIDAVRRIAKSRGYELILQPVSNAGDIYRSAVPLLRRVDAVYTGMDHLVVENLDALLKAASEAGRPVLAGDEGSVERGALAATAVSMFDLGVATGRMTARVLRGAKPGEMAVEVLSTGTPVVNRTTAARFGIDLAPIGPNVKVF